MPRTYQSSTSSKSSPRRRLVVSGAGGAGAIGTSIRLGTAGSTTTTPHAALSALLNTIPISTPVTASNRFHNASSAKGQTPPRRSPRARPNPITKVFTQIEKVVPLGIWIALAVAVAFAGAGAAATLHSRRRIRRQAGELSQIAAAAVTDPLTGLLNRRGFNDAVERELARARRHERSFVLAYIDVRGMKAINDSEGHRAGDELLRQAARLLQESARANDVVGRLGGDEMGVLLVEPGEDGAAAVRRRIQAKVAQRREEMSFQSPWDLTIGTAAFPADGDTVDELLSTADRRLYEQRGIELLYDPAFDDRR